MSIFSGVKNRLSRLTSLFPLLALLSVPVHAGELPPDLNTYILRGIAQWKMPGLSVAVIKDGKVVLCRGYGVREYGKPDKVDENTIFAIGSATKAFTAAAVGTLVDSGKIDWDTHVVDVWPTFQLSDPWATKEIRVSDLLANHSGLNGISEELWYGTTYTREEILARLKYVPIDQGFRYQFQYRNTMFLTAGQLIPRVSGFTWDQYLTNVIFTPLGMTRTFPTEEGIEKLDDVSTPHIADYSGNPLPITYRNMTNIGPAGSIVSSVKDMSKWALLQINGGVWNGRPVIQSNTLDFIHSSQTPLFGIPPLPKVELAAYALGWLAESYQGTPDVWHNGDIDGNAAWVGFVPSQNLAVVILSNLDASDFRRAIFYKILDGYEGNTFTDLNPQIFANYQAKLVDRNANEALYQRLTSTPVKPDLALVRYQGTFRNAALGDVTMQVVRGKLTFIRSSLQTLELVCQQGSQFLAKYTTTQEDLRSGKATIQFTVENGVVTGFTQDGLSTYRLVAAAK